MATLDEIRRWARGQAVDGLPSKRAAEVERPKLTRHESKRYSLNEDGTDAMLKFGLFRGQSLSALVATARGRKYLHWIIGREFEDDLKEVCRFQLKKFHGERKKKP